MKYLKYFEQRAYSSNYVSIIDSDIEKFLPQKIDIYTMGGGGDGGGNYQLELDAVTREIDVLRVPYSQNTPEKEGGDVLADGEPDNLEFDMHFVRKHEGNSSKLKINVDLTYGDSMVSSFSLEQPNKVIVNHYTGLGSHIDTETHFGLCDESLKELVKFFNRFGFTLHEKDFSFIDKYPETYVHEGLKLTPLSGDKKLLIVNNAKPQENRYFKNVQKWCQNRGIEYVVAISDRDVERIIENENIVGCILTGSDFRITNPLNSNEGEGSRKALEILGCPILGICYGFQTMAKFHGAKIKNSGKSHLDNLVLTESDATHPLFKGVALDNTSFSFAYNDIVTECPDGFKVIAKIDDIIAGIANDQKKRYGLLFHPEDMQRTYTVLDNFVAMFDDVMKGQDAIKMGQFQYLESFSKFSKFKINESEEKQYLLGVFDDVIEELSNKNFEVEIKTYDSGEEMPDLVLEIGKKEWIGGQMFDYTPELYNALNHQLKFLENFSDVNLIGTEYEYFQDMRMGMGNSRVNSYWQQYSFFTKKQRRHKSHFDHLLDMDMFKHYIRHRSVDEKLLKLRLYFRFEQFIQVK